MIIDNYYYIITHIAARFHQTTSAFWMASSGQKIEFGITDDQENFIINMCDFVVSIVSAVGLAPLGASASAGRVREKFRSRTVLAF